ncbi:MAG: Glutamine synthetase type I, partial [uncultured Sphingomonadaceae bacterium]
VRRIHHPEAHRGRGDRMGRPPLHRPERPLAPHDHVRVRHGRGPVHRRHHVRRLFDRRVEGDQRVRHDPAARPERRVRRSVLGDPDARRLLHGRRSGFRRVVQPGSPRDRDAGGGVPQGVRRRRHRVCGAGGRVLHVRRRPLRGRLHRQLLQDRRCRDAHQLRARVRVRKPRPPSAQERRLRAAGTHGQRCGHPRGDGFDDDADGSAHGQASSRGRPRSARAWHDVRQAARNRRPDAGLQIRRPAGRPRIRQDRDVHAQADRQGQRVGHAHASVDLEGRQATVRGHCLCRPVGYRDLLHRRHHQTCQGAQRLHQPFDQQLQAPRSRLRSARAARLLIPQPFRLMPHSLRRGREVQARRGPLPLSPRQPVPRLRGADDGGPGRHPEPHPPGRAHGQEPVRPPAAGAAGHSYRMHVAARGAGRTEQGPRLPATRRRLFRRPDRQLHRTQDRGPGAAGHDAEPGRVRHVLLAL